MSRPKYRIVIPLTGRECVCPYCLGWHNGRPEIMGVPRWQRVYGSRSEAKRDLRRARRFADFPGAEITPAADVDRIRRARMKAWALARTYGMGPTGLRGIT